MIFQLALAVSLAQTRHSSIKAFKAFTISFKIAVLIVIVYYLLAVL